MQRDELCGISSLCFVDTLPKQLKKQKNASAPSSESQAAANRIAEAEEAAGAAARAEAYQAEANQAEANRVREGGVAAAAAAAALQRDDQLAHLDREEQEVAAARLQAEDEARAAEA